MNKIIDEITNLEHFREINCANCKRTLRVHVLEIYATCNTCETRHKCRGFGGIGIEIQDVIDAVLKWAGQGESFEAVLERHKRILASKDSDQ